MRWFSRGDLDGFFGLALDNLVQLLLIAALWNGVIQPPDPSRDIGDDLLYTRVLPGVAVSLLVGNLFYAWQARRLARQTGRDDVCALPYGINTVTVFAHVFLVMLPAKLVALDHGMSPNEAARVAWQAGLVACFGSGFIELLGSFGAEYIRKMTPRAALLSTLAGIALGFISLSFFFQTYARPIVGLATFGIILVTYFGRVRFRGGLPGGLVAVAVGTLLSWLTGIAGKDEPPLEVRFMPPVPVFGDLAEAFGGGHFLAYLSVIIPMGLFNLVGSLQNIESAEAAGDLYPTGPSLAANGIGTLAACAFGSCFPTTIYIGHPGWKAMGARAGYSILNALFFTIVCLTGTLALIAWAVPVDAGMAIVLWIGIVIMAQAFQATPTEHAPAVVVGLLPSVAAWGIIMAKNGVRAAANLTNSGPLFSEKLLAAFPPNSWPDGGFRLEQGFIFTSIILAAATVAVIERQFVRAAAWCAAAAYLTMFGLMHCYEWLPTDTVMAFPFKKKLPYLDVALVPWPWVLGYGLMGVVFFLSHWLTVEDKAAH
jgi:AGZA family xanthine/uracil permease-like MFS transporter